jgi:two-component sensor histidine kinase
MAYSSATELQGLPSLSHLQSFQTAVQHEPLAIGGPEVLLPARQALALGMIFHELATNAAKYGRYLCRPAV